MREAAAADDVVAIPLRSPSVTRTLGIVTRKDSALSPTARQFLEHVAAALKARFEKGAPSPAGST
ncbi:MAG TPA: LysR substrate-binding domain-containing protein [Beijerinckiaceae bacterium]|nr:LysR substrate-binding domain-containing protein [Beijerinckiaceae bacterium]